MADALIAGDARGDIKPHARRRRVVVDAQRPGRAYPDTTLMIATTIRPGGEPRQCCFWSRLPGNGGNPLDRGQLAPTGQRGMHSWLGRGALRWRRLTFVLYLSGELTKEFPP
jgi:hypothetical protein